LAPIPAWAFASVAAFGPEFALTTPRGAWLALLYYSFLATLDLACTIPHRPVPPAAPEAQPHSATRRDAQQTFTKQLAPRLRAFSMKGSEERQALPLIRVIERPRRMCSSFWLISGVGLSRQGAIADHPRFMNRSKSENPLLDRQPRASNARSAVDRDRPGLGGSLGSCPAA